MLRKFIAVVALATAAVFATGNAAGALDEPRVPENVGQYFASGLVPRLVDLFGAKAGSEVVFDSATKVGGIRRVLSWTTAFLSGAKTDEPTRLTNTWVAPVTAADGTIAGVATVWINPASDQPELADFSSGPALATALGLAPTGTLIIRDDSRSAWFATDGSILTPLVSGSSGVSAATTPADYQRQFLLVAPVTAEPAANRGLLIAVFVLGIVVVLLAVFVLLPVGRRRVRAKVALISEPVTTSAPPPITEIAPSVMVPVTPAAAKPTAKPAAAKPAAAKPAAADPAAAKKPAAAKPAAKKPAAAKPAAKKPAAALRAPVAKRSL